ncbi:hypothetical protein RRG08_049569 [Elysia crispata]|uniref:Uncharacterized protein n=1 Tax=Elysia crispata TaxID=231223 RepID=A0AAE1AUG9_9GAST|nr:hypothetical protein RRG08_049569 [Elysia crispata]
MATPGRSAPYSWVPGMPDNDIALLTFQRFTVCFYFPARDLLSLDPFYQPETFCLWTHSISPRPFVSGPILSARDLLSLDPFYQPETFCLWTHSISPRPFVSGPILSARDLLSLDPFYQPETIFTFSDDHPGRSANCLRQRSPRLITARPPPGWLAENRRVQQLARLLGLLGESELFRLLVTLVNRGGGVHGLHDRALCPRHGTVTQACHGPCRATRVHDFWRHAQGRGEIRLFNQF